MIDQSGMGLTAAGSVATVKLNFGRELLMKFAVFIYFVWVSAGLAQDASCVTRRQFQRGEFTAQSVPCDPQLAVPLTYCHEGALGKRERMELFAIADFGTYYGPFVLGNEMDFAQQISMADGLRLLAFADEEASETVRGLFYALSTAHFAAQIAELAERAGEEKSGDVFRMLQNSAPVSDYFLYPLPSSIPTLERMLECAVRCGDKGADMRAITRSKAYENCAGD